MNCEKDPIKEFADECSMNSKRIIDNAVRSVEKDIEESKKAEKRRIVKTIIRSIVIGGFVGGAIWYSSQKGKK